MQSFFGHFLVNEFFNTHEIKHQPLRSFLSGVIWLKWVVNSEHLDGLVRAGYDCHG
jgi:hypothetical protein